MFFALLLTSLAFADDAVTLQEGDPAPFTGTLLSPEAAAKIIVDSDYSIERCRLEAERDLALQEARLTLDFNNVSAELAACHLRSTELNTLHMEQIEFLERQVVTPKWQPILYYAAGVLTGAAMIYGSAHMVKGLGN